MVETLDPDFEPGSYPRWDDATRYYWSEPGRSDTPEYHWFRDCPWLLTSLSGGETLVVSGEAPANAAERSDLPHLCRICAREWPVTGLMRDAGEEPCATCGCPEASHVDSPDDGPAGGCRISWTEVRRRAVGDEYVLSTPLACRCDGFRRCHRAPS